MNSLKKFIWVIIATIVIGYLIVWTFQAFEPGNPFFTFLINWLVMSWAAIVGDAIPFSLPGRYYESKAFERSGRLYEYLGIRLFKKLVRRGPLAVFSPTLRLHRERTVSTLQSLEREMRKAETSHLLLFLVMSVFAMYAGFQGWLAAVGWILAFNILLNGYPVMLQRYNRIRLQAVIGTYKESEN